MSAISIVIPVLDDAAHLSQLLPMLRESAAAARVAAEIIVVDGGSSDDSAVVAARGADRVLLASRGRASQLAAGVRAAHGELIWMLHADSGGVQVEHFRTLDHLLHDRSRHWGRFDARLGARGVLFRLIEIGMNTRSRVTGICTGDQGIFVRRGILDAVGGIPEQSLMEDIELTRRLRRLGRPLCARVPLVTSARRWQTHGVIETVLLMWSLRVRYFLGGDPDVLARRYYRRPV